MKNKIIAICLLLLFVFISTLFAETLDDKKWSFEFSGLSISEVLNKIRDASGVEILLNSNMEMQPITGSYENYTIDGMLLDIFSDENLAAVFHYDDKGLSSINVWILSEGGEMDRGLFENDPLQYRKTDKMRTTYLNREHGRIIEPVSGFRMNDNTSIKYNERISSNKTNKKHFVSTFKKYRGLNSENNAGENGSGSEAIDIPALPDTMKTLGLEPPPMPPGISL